MDLVAKNTWKRNISVHLKRSAEARRCPKCGRGAALKSDANIGLGSVTYCRWEGCGYERIGEPIRGI